MFNVRGRFGDPRAIGNLFGGPLRPSSVFEEREKSAFADIVAQKMGTGPAQGNGGYATGQSPEEQYKKAQTGLLKSQTANADLLRDFSVEGDFSSIIRSMMNPGSGTPNISFNPTARTGSVQFPQTQAQMPESMQSYGLRPQGYDPFQPFGGFGFRQ